jgi:hypothetical protein
MGHGPQSWAFLLSVRLSRVQFRRYGAALTYRLCPTLSFQSRLQGVDSLRRFRLGQGLAEFVWFAAATIPSPYRRGQHFSYVRQERAAEAALSVISEWSVRTRRRTGLSGGGRLLGIGQDRTRQRPLSRLHLRSVSGNGDVRPSCRRRSGLRRGVSRENNEWKRRTKR